MEIEKAKAIIEAILFACGREVQIKELMSALELKITLMTNNKRKTQFKNEQVI